MDKNKKAKEDQPKFSSSRSVSSQKTSSQKNGSVKNKPSVKNDDKMINFKDFYDQPETNPASNRGKSQKKKNGHHTTLQNSDSRSDQNNEYESYYDNDRNSRQYYQERDPNSQGIQYGQNQYGRQFGQVYQNRQRQQNRHGQYGQSRYSSLNEQSGDGQGQNQNPQYFENQDRPYDNNYQRRNHDSGFYSDHDHIYNQRNPQFNQSDYGDGYGRQSNPSNSLSGRSERGFAQKNSDRQSTRDLGPSTSGSRNYDRRRNENPNEYDDRNRGYDQNTFDRNRGYGDGYDIGRNQQSHNRFYQSRRGRNEENYPDYFDEYDQPNKWSDIEEGRLENYENNGEQGYRGRRKIYSSSGHENRNNYSGRNRQTSGSQGSYGSGSNYEGGHYNENEDYQTHW